MVEDRPGLFLLLDSNSVSHEIYRFYIYQTQLITQHPPPNRAGTNASYAAPPFMPIPYGLIVLIGSIALVVWFVLATKASWISKGIVAILFLLTFGPFFHWLGINPLVRLFLRVAISIFIIFYRTIQQTRMSKKPGNADDDFPLDGTKR